MTNFPPAAPPPYPPPRPGPPAPRLAIVSGGRVISAPTVNEPITGAAIVISGGFGKEDAEKLARSLSG